MKAVRNIITSEVRIGAVKVDAVLSRSKWSALNKIKLIGPTDVKSTSADTAPFSKLFLVGFPGSER